MNNSISESVEVLSAGSRRLESALAIPIDQIDPNPHQPRHQLQESDISELKTSIEQKGILQPLLVAPNGDRFILIAGYRRLTAAQRAGLETVPCIVRKMTEAEMLQLALIENLQRLDLNPIEEAEAIDALLQSSGVDQKAVAELINKSVGFVSERTSLMKLPDDIKSLVSAGRLPIRKALEIGKLGRTDARQKLSERAERFGIEEIREIVRKRLEKERDGRKKYERKAMESSFRSVLKELPNVRIYKDRVSFTFDNENELIDSLKKLLDQLTREL